MAGPYFTTAPKDYDWGCTVQLIDHVAVTKHGKIVRLVEIEDEYLADQQIQRYGSGLHPAWTPSDFKKEVDAGFAAYTPDKAIHYYRHDFDTMPILSDEDRMTKLGHFADMMKELLQAGLTITFAHIDNTETYRLTVAGPQNPALLYFGGLVEQIEAILGIVHPLQTKDVPLQTKLGQVKMTWTEAGHVYVTAESDQPILVNGVRLYLGLHLNRYENGFDLTRNEYGRGEYHYLTARKIDEPNYNKADASDAARKKILTIMTAAINEWAANNPAILAQAELNHCTDLLNRVEGEQVELMKKLEEVNSRVVVMQGQVETAKATLAQHLSGLSATFGTI